MQYFKYILILLVCLSTDQVQAQRSIWDTLPPQVIGFFQFRVLEVQSGTGGNQQATVFFRSTNNPDQLIRGLGRMYYEEGDFTGPTALLDSVAGTMIMQEPDSPPNSTNWPGGQPPYPMLLTAFVQRVDGILLEPRRRVTVQVNRVYFEDLTE